MKKSIDYVKIVCLTISIVILAFAWVHYMNVSDANVRTDDAIMAPSGVTQNVSVDTGSNVIVSNFSVEELQENIKATQLVVDDITNLQNTYIRVAQVGFEQNWEAFEANVKFISGKLREYGPSINWFVDVWYSWNESYNDVLNASWEGFVDMSNVLDETQIPVVWLCRTGEGKVLAFVKAVYHLDTGTFTNGERKGTLRGWKLLAFSDTYDAYGANRTDEFVEDVQALISDSLAVFGDGQYEDVGTAHGG